MFFLCLLKFFWNSHNSIHEVPIFPAQFYCLILYTLSLLSVYTYASPLTAILGGFLFCFSNSYQKSSRFKIYPFLCIFRIGLTIFNIINYCHIYFPLPLLCLNTNRSIKKFVLIFLANAAQYISHNPQPSPKQHRPITHLCSSMLLAPCIYRICPWQSDFLCAC